MTAGHRGLGAGRYTAVLAEPDDVTTSVHQLRTHDQAQVTGVLRRPAGARTVVTFMHPRQDVTNHALVPHFLAAGLAVWTQGSRSPNNDLALLHEQAIIDFAAGQVFLRDLGFESVVALGHSGGGTLAAFYLQQAALPPGRRLTRAPSGRPVPLAETEMPLPTGFVALAPHPGQGALLRRVIDPSVVDEADPLSRDPALDPFDPANGFVDAPRPVSYSPDFVAAYRQAQWERVARVDAVAADLVAARRGADAEFRESGEASRRRAALAPALITVYRTDADLRNVDLGLDPNKRAYGSLFGRRPDLTNYGLVGFGRLSTAEAWMSTWSATTTNADFLRCAAGVTVPTLLLEFTGDQASFPADVEAFAAAIPAPDLTVDALDGTHFGDRLVEGAPTGNELAAARVVDWIAERS
ncbi:alpha/beta hydrolase family protein [Umezawaea endophytica]|uniref:Alpha/beta hydrolase family protein n=1 Tax=Umezawaea endophytica TaxID=1654476 RepID=A0A9X3AG70_9PSEU|nr:alpha/beta hydrolase family protein [Umezawaea endophytica]MCS7478035.1 alpha/beta hydrolase family protein [Umezawaea endophytica]